MSNRFLVFVLLLFVELIRVDRGLVLWTAVVVFPRGT
jgi:hypothetical protein